MKVTVNRELVGKQGMAIAYLSGSNQTSFISFGSSVLPVEFEVDFDGLDDTIIIFAFDAKYSSVSNVKIESINRAKAEIEQREKQERENKVQNYVENKLSELRSEFLSKHQTYLDDPILSYYLSNDGEITGRELNEFDQAHPGELKLLYQRYKNLKSEVEARLDSYKAGKISFDELMV